MNMDNFTVTQTGCSDVTFTYSFMDPSVAPVVVDYIPDAVTRIYSAQAQAAAWTGTSLTLSSTDGQGNVTVIQYSFQTVPCNLYNPDGSNYLTSETWVNGVYDQSSCQFFEPIQNSPQIIH